MAARSWVPGFSDVVCTEKGGPLSPDQFSHRQVTTTAIRAPFGQPNWPEEDCLEEWGGNGIPGSLFDRVGEVSIGALMSISSAGGSGRSATTDPFSTPLFEPRYHVTFSRS